MITVENLGKKYIIGHQRQNSGVGYITMRDTIAHYARGIYQRCRHPLSPNRENTELEELWALKDINFEIKQGERVGIIGRNGAGKSTLLKILSRITEPTTGRIRMNGRVASLLEVGTGFHPELTGRENIFLNGAVLGMSRIEIKKKFDEIVDFSDVEKFLDTPVKRYSSGMKVRLGFAVAAHLEPEILLIDEVLAVGDAEFQKKCLGKMEDISQSQGRTILFVSHNMMAIRALCAKTIHVDGGMIHRLGDTENVVSEYLHQHIAEKSCASRIWSAPDDAPGNDKVRMKSIVLTWDGMDKGEGVKTNSSVKLALQAWILKEQIDLNFSIHFKDISGGIIFNVWSQRKIMDQGVVEGIMEIPANFLNDKIYSLDIMLVSNSVCQVKLEDILSFKVEDHREGNWYGNVPGVIRPVILRFPIHNKP